MLFTPTQRKNGTVVILGAGASYGSSLKSRPPVMNNFIREGIKRVTNKYYEKLWRFLKSIGYPLEALLSGSPNLEEIYSVLHITSSGLWHVWEPEYITAIGHDFWKIPPVYFLESFIMEVTNKPSIEAINKPCHYHDTIVCELRSGDSIIDFNYDLIADASLRHNKVWSEYNGYGFPCSTQAQFDNDNGEELLGIHSEVGLLKPHGSLNWYAIDRIRTGRDGNIISPEYNLRSRLLGDDQPHQILVERLKNIKKKAHRTLPIAIAEQYDKLVAQTPKKDRWKFEGVRCPYNSSFIIPPSLYKFGSSNTPTELRIVWNQLFKALERAGKIICIGYSFPPNDMEFNTLFRLAIRNNDQERLKILLVNPSAEIKDKVQALVPEKKVAHIADTFANFIRKG